MGSATTNLSLYKPAVNETGWGTLVDANWDTIDTLFGQTKNVKVFGAIGNGVADDTVAVQNTINAAASSGGVCFFPSGTYLVGPITLPPQVVLQGVNGITYLIAQQQSISRLKLKSSSSSALLSPSDGGAVKATGVQINDLVLDSNNNTQPAINLADQGSSVPRFWTIQRCTIVNSGYSSGSQGYHVYIGNFNAACVMRDCQLLSNEAGVTTQNSHGWRGIGWYGSDGLCDNVYIGCYADTGLLTLSGSSDMTFLFRGGGSFWNNTGVVIGGEGCVIDSASFDHNYNDGAYIGFACSFSNCTFHSNSLQTTNHWAHIHVANPVVVNIASCRQAPQDGDAGSNIAKYFIDAVASSLVNQSGNYLQDPGATLGTGWTNYTGAVTTPSFPSTTVVATNTTGSDVTAYIANGTSAITVVKIGGITTGMQIAANGWGTVRILNGLTAAFTYGGGTPTWVWVGG